MSFFIGSDQILARRQTESSPLSHNFLNNVLQKLQLYTNDLDISMGEFISNWASNFVHYLNNYEDIKFNKTIFLSVK